MGVFFGSPCITDIFVFFFCFFFVVVRNSRVLWVDVFYMHVNMMQISNSITGFLKRALDKQLNICDWDYLIAIESKMSENIKRTLTYIFENWEIKFVIQVGFELGPSWREESTLTITPLGTCKSWPHIIGLTNDMPSVANPRFPMVG